MHKLAYLLWCHFSFVLSKSFCKLKHVSYCNFNTGEVSSGNSFFFATEFSLWNMTLISASKQCRTKIIMSDYYWIFLAYLLVVTVLGNHKKRVILCWDKNSDWIFTFKLNRTLGKYCFLVWYILKQKHSRTDI